MVWVWGVGVTWDFWRLRTRVYEVDNFPENPDPYGRFRRGIQETTHRGIRWEIRPYISENIGFAWGELRALALIHPNRRVLGRRVLDSPDRWVVSAQSPSSFARFRDFPAFQCVRPPFGRLYRALFFQFF